MKKLIVEAEVSLDGIMNHPELWGEIFKYHSDDVSKYLEDLLFIPEALVMGRITYEGFNAHWPAQKGKVADRINSMPKFVASKTLEEPLDWNAKLIKGNVIEEIRKLKEGSGKGLLQYGVGSLTRTLLDANLVDEIQLMVFPFVFGKGESWFDKIELSHFKLVDQRSFSSGVVLLRYQPIQQTDQ